MTRLLCIDADLSTPPSSPSCWRDITLYAAIRDYDIVASCPREMLDWYDEWMARNGLWDYVDALLTPQEVKKEKINLYIEGGPKARLTMFNLSSVIDQID